MSEFTEKVIERIKHEGIEPEAGWKFTAKRSAIWIGVILGAGLGALSLSMIMFSVASIDRNPFTMAPERLFSFAFFRSLPFLWIGLLFAFSLLAMFEFRNTRHGYRHRIAAVAVLSGIVIVVGATLFSAWGADEQAERMMRQRFPHYAKMAAERETFWSRPEEGFLSGTITGVTEETISLTDGKGSRWEVAVGDHTTIRPAVRLEPGTVVKVLGRRTDDARFVAEDIRPWDRMRSPDREHEPMMMPKR